MNYILNGSKQLEGIKKDGKPWVETIELILKEIHLAVFGSPERFIFTDMNSVSRNFKGEPVPCVKLETEELDEECLCKIRRLILEKTELEVMVDTLSGVRIYQNPKRKKK